MKVKKKEKRPQSKGINLTDYSIGVLQSMYKGTRKENFNTSFSKRREEECLQLRHRLGAAESLGLVPTSVAAPVPSNLHVCRDRPCCLFIFCILVKLQVPDTRM